MTSAQRLISATAVLFLTAAAVGNTAMETRAGTVPSGESITLNVNNAPLAAALNRISNSTGYRIRVDQKWSGSPVSAAFEHLPLEKGLKRLLKDFDHAIVFETDRTIRIIIYGKTGSSAGSSPGRPYVAVPAEDIEAAPEPEHLAPRDLPVESGKSASPDTRSPSDTETSDADAEPAQTQEDPPTDDDKKE